MRIAVRPEVARGPEAASARVTDPVEGTTIRHTDGCRRSDGRGFWFASRQSASVIPSAFDRGPAALHDAHQP